MTLICTEKLCLTSGAIKTIYEKDSVRITIGYIDGKPFSALVIDTRDGGHLHFPAWEVEPILATALARQM